MIQFYVQNLRDMWETRNDDMVARPAESDQIQSDRQKKTEPQLTSRNPAYRGKDQSLRQMHQGDEQNQNQVIASGWFEIITKPVERRVRRLNKFSNPEFGIWNLE